VPAVEKAVRERLPDRLATKLLRDPVSGALSAPGETPETFASRVAGAAKIPAALQQKLDTKRRALAAAEEQEKARSMETWTTAAGAALDVIGGLYAKRKSVRVGKVGTVLSKRRMEGAAEARIEDLKAEIAALEEKVAMPDPSRFEEIDVVPLKAHVDILSVGVAWVV
jgi:hypothetical protein